MADMTPEDVEDIDCHASAGPSSGVTDPSETQSSKAGESMLKQQREGSMCDCTIECDGGDVLAHKSILAAGSDFFKTELAHTACEAESPRVQLSGHVSVATMSKIIEFIYTGTVDLNCDEAKDVLIGAKFLQMNDLVEYCYVFFRTHLNAADVLRLYGAANQIGLAELSDFAFGFVKQHLASFMTNELFLDQVDSALMSALLESDDLVVASEDSVVNFLVAWLDKDRNSRTQHVAELKKRIRFPFLTLSALRRLEEIAGPIPDIPRLENVEKWNLKLPLFKRRKYTSVHCHFGWEQSESGLASKLFLSCGILGEKPEILISGTPSSTRAMSKLAVCGHTMYSCSDTLTSLVSFNGRTVQGLTPKRLAVFKGGSGHMIDELRAVSSGDLCVASGPQAKIYVVDTKNRRFKRANSWLTRSIKWTSVPLQWSTRPRILWDEHPPVADLVRDLAEEPVELDPEDCNPFDIEDFTLAYCKDSIQRGDTVFAYYQCPLLRSWKHFVTSFNITNRHRSKAIDVPETWDELMQVFLLEIRGQIYVLVQTHGSPFIINRLDEKNERFERVQAFTFPNADFLGVAPPDAGPPCKLDTWLSVQCRKLPDGKSSQRATIEKLRRLLR